jgi:hypothetical protein
MCTAVGATYRCPMVHVTVRYQYEPGDRHTDEYVVRDTAAALQARMDAGLRSGGIFCVVDATRVVWSYIPETVRWFRIRELPQDQVILAE